MSNTVSKMENGGDPLADAFYEMRDERDYWKKRALAAEKMHNMSHAYASNPRFEDAYNAAIDEWYELMRVIHESPTNDTDLKKQEPK